MGVYLGWWVRCLHGSMLEGCQHPLSRSLAKDKEGVKLERIDLVLRVKLLDAMNEF